MDNSIKTTLLSQIELLNAQDVEQLQLFTDFLLNRHKLVLKNTAKKNKKEKKRKILHDLETVAIPVDNIIVDRELIYNDRF